MKKLLIISMCLALSLVCTTVGLAAETVQVEEPLERAQQYAYMDLEAASPEMKEKILEARKEIIYSQSWVADGYTMTVEDGETGEIRNIPTFSELFPDWEIPIVEFSSEDSAVSSVISPMNETDWIEIATRNNVTISSASSSTTASPFLTTRVDPYDDGTSVRTRPTSLEGISTCNIGYTDMSSGRDMGYYEGARVNDNVQINGLYNTLLGIRTSTYEANSGTGDFLVRAANRVTDVR